ncbi:hypothetical protein LBMAG47_02080 [Planctomycetia bacterium]|nr:hypothetical protein LBMAG47_02080 [Planctomycetia bacterium]
MKVRCRWAMCLALCLGLCLVLCLEWPAPAARAAAPVDSATLKTLSVDDAKRLAAEIRGRLSLDSLTTLPDDVAKELAKREGWLSLNGLTTLSNGAAEALGGHKGYLLLDGLTALSNEAAASLAKHGGYLSLNGIKTLPDEAAAPLFQTGGMAGHAGTRGGLSLRGLTTLSPAAAKAIAGRKSIEIRIDGLTTLTPEAAAILMTVHPHAWNGALPGITTVSEELAQIMASRGVSLPGLKELSPAVAKKFEGKLGSDLRGLTSLSPEAATLALKQARGVNLDGLTELSEELAQVLAKTSGPLSLNGLKTLSASAAEAISRRDQDISLLGLAEIELGAAKILAAHGGHPNYRTRVHLDGLTKLSAETAAVLSGWNKWSGRLPLLTELSEPAAAALVSSRNFDGRLPALKTLDAGAAKWLAESRGGLVLDGLTALPDDVAAAFASHRGNLSLNGLKTLSDKAAAALASQQGILLLNGLTTLSDAAAKSLAAHAGELVTMELGKEKDKRTFEQRKSGRLGLDGLTTVSPAAARALAASAGHVSLRGLKAVPDDVAAILRESRHVELPAAVGLKSASVAAASADEKVVHAFLGTHCGECHGDDAEEIKGEFAIDKPWPTMGSIAGRVAYASILERLRAGDMPPPDVKDRPAAADSARVIGWILGQLDTPLAGPATPYAVKDKPVDGNRLPHAILFGGPRGPSVPPPPRLWRLSPAAYSSWVSKSFNTNDVNQQPFGLIQESGIKDFAALYSPDEGASGLLLTNAELIVESQTRPHSLINVKEKPDEAKKRPWPVDGRFDACSPAEKKLLDDGVRVAGGGAFAAILHPHVAATRAELEAAIAQQFKTALARDPLPAETESLVKLYETLARDGDHRIAGKTILMAPLLSPEAVLRFEVGTGAEVRPGVRMLSPREIALAVSLALGTIREPGLFQAAAGGGLTTREDVAAHVRRILDTQNTPKPRVMQFFQEYFGYHHAPDVFKDPPPEYHRHRGRHFSASNYVTQSNARVLDVLTEDRQVLARLLTGDEAIAEPGELHWGAINAAANAPFRTLPPHAVSVAKGPAEGRVGLLMQPAWLVAWSTNFHTDPVRRGRWIREQLLGGRVPDLPINAAAMIPDDPHRTLRERQFVTREAQCWKCHYRMEDLGLPFEAYDHYGWSMEGEEVVDLAAMEKSGNKGQKLFRSAPLDTTGFIANSGDPALDGPVADAPEMLRRLASSERVRQVFVRYAFRFFMGRNETPGDAPTLQDADRAYVESDGSFRALLVSLLSSESFLYRTVSGPAAGPAKPPAKTAQR